MSEASEARMSELAARAEAFLLAEGGPMTLRELSRLLGCEEGAARAALDEIERAIEGSGIALVRTEHEQGLATSPRVSEAVQAAFGSSLSREIGNAGLEVLAIILYRGASTRARIDHIRGVNTSSTIRLLLSRGLLERVPNPQDGREYVYRPTTELLAHLGVRRPEELPDYDTIRGELAAFETTETAFEDHGNTADTAGA